VTLQEWNPASGKEIMNEEELKIIESVAGLWRKELGYSI
jgi:hypothetical protein